MLRACVFCEILYAGFGIVWRPECCCNIDTALVLPSFTLNFGIGCQLFSEKMARNMVCCVNFR